MTNTQPSLEALFNENKDNIFEDLKVKIVLSDQDWIDKGIEKSDKCHGYKLKEINIGDENSEDKENSEGKENSEDKESEDKENSPKSHSALYNETEEAFKKIKKRVLDEKDWGDWHVFYLFKEIFQEIERIANSSDPKYETYFRGQSDNWEIVPGVFRKDFGKNSIGRFEDIYEEIYQQYPDEVEYVPMDDVFDEEEHGEKRRQKMVHRAMQISTLQHYALPTPLIDITSNPYIALLFMIFGGHAENFKNGTLDIFLINPEKHKKENIFMSVPKSEHNRRVTAQKGAFLNYEKLYDYVTNGISDKAKIFHIRVFLEFQTARLFLDRVTKTIDKIKEKKETDTNKVLIKNLEVIAKAIEEKAIVEEMKIRVEVFNDIKNKLAEYHYYEENLFPDFYKYVLVEKKKFFIKKGAQLLHDKEGGS